MGPYSSILHEYFSLGCKLSAEFSTSNINILCYNFVQVCPVCAALPGGDPNHVTDDFTAHLTLEHRAPRDFVSFFHQTISHLGVQFDLKEQVPC